jgi:hypothetical protein
LPSVLARKKARKCFFISRKSGKRSRQ